LGPPTALIGRAEEVSLVEARLTAAAKSEGSVVLISGEPGIGKTRLLRDIVSQARSARVSAALGRCYEYLQSPYGPIADILNDLCETDNGALAALPKVRDDVDTFLTSPGSIAGSEGTDKRRLFAALRNALDAYCRERPVLMALDDLQWADSLTLDLVQYLVEHASQSRLVILATYRSADVDQSEPLHRALANLARGASAFHRELGPLSQGEIRSLLRTTSTSTSPDETRRIASIAQQSDGNPLLAEELSKTTESAEAVSLASPPLPTSVTAATRARLAGLSPLERRALACAAAIGRSFTPALLGRVAQLSDPNVLKAIKHGVSTQLVEPDFDGRSLRFRHELVRRAVYDELLPDEARALHRLVADALESAPESPQRATDLAYHYWMAAETVKAADYNEASGDRALRMCAYAEAAENYDRALKSIGHGDAARAASIQENLGEALYGLGRSEAARAAYLVARAFNEPRSVAEPVARLSVKIATILRSEGREMDAISECEKALALVDERSPSFFRAHSYLGLLNIDRDGDAAMAHFTLADRYTGERAQDDALVFHQCRALALGQRGDAVGMAADFRNACKIARAKGNVSLAIRCLGNLGLKLTDLGERSQALAAFDEAAAIIAQEDLWNLDCAVYLRQHAWACLQFGDLAHARELILRALEYPTDSPRLRAFAVQAAIPIGLRVMDDDLANRFGDTQELEAVFAPGNESMLVTALAFAERDIALGRRSEGVTLIHRVVEAYAGVPLARDDDGVFILAALHGADDDAKTARAFVARYADDTKAEIASAHLLLYDAVMARRSEDAERATALAESARELYERLGWRWHVARALEIGGKLRDSVVVYEETGDVRSAQRAREILNPVNRRGRTKSELTEREREIATLAAAGRSTKEIADALTVSPRTIETHLASVFAKLSVRNRAELIARWRDLPGAAQASP
jgi:DNA-binding CsgD family transcriptional regulator